MTAHLIIKNLSLGYGEKDHDTPVITKLDLELEKGEIGCLLGPSGCGKSTLLRAIAGFQSVYKGSVTLNGRILSSDIENILPEQRRIGYMFQDFALFPHLTIEKNIGFGLQNFTKTERTHRISELLTLVDLEKEAKRYPHELSGGQQQRVALVRALAPKPELLLLDEPFSSLDESMREKLSREVRMIIQNSGCTALMVTHNINEAHAMADRMGFIENQRINSWTRPPKDPSPAHGACE